MKSLFAIAAAALLAAGCAASKAPPAAEACHTGVYRLADGGLVDVGPISDGGLRWRLMDGRTGKLTPKDEGWESHVGWSDRPDGVAVAFGACEEARIRFAGQDGRKVQVAVQETTFTGDGGTTLAGRLVMPPGDGPVPVIVMVHGSEDYSARQFYAEPRLWPAQGVGVFVYDKRGTGGSDGKYTQDFHVLARDGAAAVAEARRLAGKRIARLGVDGGSQGGWIGPLAATLTPVDFVIARYGMAESALAENRGEVLRGLADKGYGPDVLAKAGEVADATGKIMASDFKDGWEEVAALKRRYGAEPWWKDLDGEFTGDLLKYPPFAVKIMGPLQSQHTSWEYDPMPTLARVNAPMLWVLAAEDREAPEAETRRRLLSLAEAGRPITVLEFPATDHGIREFEQAPDGERTYLRYAEGYYPAVLEFAKTGKLSGTYGKGQQLTP
jgi:dienelactone hydrolase